MEPGFYGIVIQGDVGQGVTGAKQASLLGIVKTDSNTAEFNVANEFIAGRLAQALGLPCPPGSMVRTATGEIVYAMMQFGSKGEKLPPANPVAVCSTHHLVAAGIVMFDEWIVNHDRHTSNLAYDPSVGVGIFDHGHALLGTARTDAQNRLSTWINQPAFGGCLLAHITRSGDLAAWIQRIRQVPLYLIEHACDTVKTIGLITREERDALVSVLKHRQSTIADRLSAAQHQFPSISDWGMNP